MENIITERLYNIFANKDITVTSIANKAGIPRQQLSAYINGNTIPRADTLGKIAKALNVSSDYLLGLSDNVTLGRSQTYESIINMIDALQYIEGTTIMPEELLYVDGAKPIDRLDIYIYDKELYTYYSQKAKLKDWFSALSPTEAIVKRLTDSLVELKETIKDKKPSFIPNTPPID